MSDVLSDTDIYCNEFRDELSISWRISGKTKFAVEYRPKPQSECHPLEHNCKDWVSDDEDLDIPEEDLRDIPGPEGVTWSAVRLEALKPRINTTDCSSQDDDTSPAAETSTHQPAEAPGRKRKGGEASRPVPLDTSKPPTNSASGPSHSEDSPSDTTTSSQQPAKEGGKKRKRGKESERRRQQKRHLPPSGLTPAQARGDKIVQGILRRTQYLRAKNLSLNTSGRVTTTGWQGLPPSKAEIRDLTVRFQNGSLNEQLRRFHRVAFDPMSKSPTALLDSMDRAFAVRTTTAHFLEKMQVELHKAMVELMGPSLLDDNVRKESEAKNPRGDHFQCLMGHQRPYHNTIILVRWHKDNEERVEEFLNKECVRELIAWVDWGLRAFFPEIADRYESCARWHQEQYNVSPLFGLFWNFCINGIFPNQTRIHTVPHADSKNVVGVCVIFVYVIPGSKFNSKARSWLVIWDAGIIIELPPWVAFFYPSSLFIHFNCDISDIEIIHTADGSRPTRASHSRSKKRETVGPEIPEDAHGRGSIVFFSQGNLFSSSETGYPTLSTARKAGCPGTTDIAANFDKYYTPYGTFVPV